MTSQAEASKEDKKNLAVQELDPGSFKPHEGVWVYDPRVGIPQVVKNMFKNLEKAEKEWEYQTLDTQKLIEAGVQQEVAENIVANIPGVVTTNSAFYNLRPILLIQANSATFGRETNPGPKLVLLNTGKPFISVPKEKEDPPSTPSKP